VLDTTASRTLKWLDESLEMYDKYSIALKDDPKQAGRQAGTHVRSRNGVAGVTLRSVDTSATCSSERQSLEQCLACVTCCIGLLPSSSLRLAGCPAPSCIIIWHVPIITWRSLYSSGQVRSGQVRSGQVRSGQVRSGQVRSGQVRSGQGMAGHTLGTPARAQQSMS
jgi:hypothetical protein